MIKIIFVKHLFYKKMTELNHVLKSILILICICFFPKNVTSQLFTPNTELGVKGGSNVH